VAEESEIAEEECSEFDEATHTTSNYFTEIDVLETDYYEMNDGDFKNGLNYIRKTFIYFRKSPVKMSTLQELIKTGEGKSMALPLDIKTRWNSVVPMVKRYVLLKKYLMKALEIFNDGQMFMTRFDNVLNDIVECLEPLQEAVIVLSKNDSNLMIAEGAMSFVFQRLSSLDSPLSRELLESSTKRYNERRNKDLVSLLMTLQTGVYPKSSQYLEYSSKAIIKKTAADLMSRLYSEEVAAIETDRYEEGNEASSVQHSEIQQMINKIMNPPAKVFDSKLEKDFKLLESTGEKSFRLKKLHSALMTVKPTSTVCEQTFSVAGSFKTKVRNRLSPNKLNALTWLKYYFVQDQSDSK
jgi:hypothetical protein